MRKVFIFIFILLSIFVILAACGGEVSDTTSEDGATSEKGEKKLTIWHIETGKMKEVLEGVVKQFEDKHDVEVEIVQHENDPYKTNLTVAMGGGNPPDIFHSWGGGWLKEFVDAGQVVELTDKVDEGQYIRAALDTTTFEDKIYGLPLSLSIVPVFYNKDIFDQYNLSPPETYEELLTIVDTLNDNSIIPFALANQTKWPGAFYLMYFVDRLEGPELFQSAFTREGRTFDDPGYIKAGKMIKELVERNAFPQGFNGLNYDTGQSRQLMYSEKAAMIIQTTSFINNVRSEAPDFEEKLDIFSFPAIEGGKGDPKNIVGGVSPAFSVTANSKHPDLAIELIKELTSVEAANKYVHASGKLPAVKGVETSDEFGKKLAKLLEEADNMQTFYDQTLPPELAELHKDTTQAIFGLELTPEEAAEAMEKKAQELLD